MAVITRFSPGQSAAEIAADTVAGAASVADAINRGYPASVTNIGLTKIREYSNTFSLDAVTAGPAQRLATSATTSDTIKMFTIPANHVVLAARLEVVTAGTGTGTLALTDGTTTLVAATAVNATGQTSGVTPKFYATATALSLAVGTATVATGAYRVVVLAVDMTGQDTTTLVTG